GHAVRQQLLELLACPLRGRYSRLHGDAPSCRRRLPASLGLESKQEGIPVSFSSNITTWPSTGARLSKTNRDPRFARIFLEKGGSCFDPVESPLGGLYGTCCTHADVRARCLARFRRFCARRGRGTPFWPCHRSRVRWQACARGNGAVERTGHWSRATHF